MRVESETGFVFLFHGFAAPAGQQHGLTVYVARGWFALGSGKLGTGVLVFFFQLAQFVEDWLFQRQPLLPEELFTRKFLTAFETLLENTTQTVDLLDLHLRTRGIEGIARLHGRRRIGIQRRSQCSMADN